MKQGKPLNARLLSQKVESNIHRAYEEIHKAGVCHNNVHKDHILVRPDHTIAIVSYGKSSTHPQEHDLRAEMKAVTAMIAHISGRPAPPNLTVTTITPATAPATAPATTAATTDATVDAAADTGATATAPTTTGV